LSLFSGLLYNFRGLRLGLRTGKLLFWGVIRFVLVLAIMSVLTGLILAYHREIMELLWTKPESRWIVWLWYLVSWLVSLLLVALAALISFIASQILFSAVIMDHMSRITERLVQGHVIEPKRIPLMALFFYLIKQEIPRAFIPVLFSLLILILGWLTPLGPVVAVVSSAAAAVFLAWDNTDLIPARRFVPFRERWRLLGKNVFFHLGFGLPFLIPVANIFFLSFAPVGATLYFIDRYDGRNRSPSQTRPAPNTSGGGPSGQESR
jgi:CysZ protein